MLPMSLTRDLTENLQLIELDLYRALPENRRGVSRAPQVFEVELVVPVMVPPPQPASR